MDADFSYSNCYLQYLKSASPAKYDDLAQLESLDFALKHTAWEEPNTAVECNNVGVLALVMAEQSDSPDSRALYIEMAVEAFQAGSDDHPLCLAHLILIKSITGESAAAIQLAFSRLIDWSAAIAPSLGASIPAGLIYLPADRSGASRARPEILPALLGVANGAQQSLLLMAEVLRRSQLVFYNAAGLRFLHLIAPLIPDSAFLQLSLGLSSLFSGQWEGMVNLHRARAIALASQLNAAAIYQALYLAYRALNQPQQATRWLALAQHKRQGEAPEWRWTMLPADSSFTYVPFDESVLMAVEANIRSIVTSVLLAEGDWFEAEMELWREHIMPGMTVMDVGANAGVYTFSAAKQVGASGRVLAIEPFAGCVRCMEETCRINHLEWVTVCEGAASDRDGTAQLSLHAASELNEIVMDETSSTSGEVVVVPCFSLDSLAEREQLTRLDWLKIDAEGHEIQVLKGSDRILSTFAPKILYENIAAGHSSNTEVAEYLQSKGYRLHVYRPFVRQLEPIESLDHLKHNLNIVALPNRA